MDGDAFRLCEKEVVGTHGGSSFVLGLHLYSDSSQLSWSGGTLPLLFIMRGHMTIAAQLLSLFFEGALVLSPACRY